MLTRPQTTEDEGLMMFTIGVSRTPYLLLICTGEPVYNDFLALVDIAAALCGREGWMRVLVDCASVPPTFTPDERAQLGAYAGKMLPGRNVALVVPDEKRFEATRSAAASEGGKLRYFTSHFDAANWLETAGHPQSRCVA